MVVKYCNSNIALLKIEKSQVMLFSALKITEDHSIFKRIFYIFRS